jgi:hypothetical protein
LSCSAVELVSLEAVMEIEKMSIEKKTEIANEISMNIGKAMQI